MKLPDPLSLANIKTCAALSRAAYDRATLIDPPTGEQVLIENSGDSLIIAFPGTHNIRDVLRDLDCLRITAIIFGKPCSVHKGFDRSHQTLIPKIISAIKEWFSRYPASPEASSLSSGTTLREAHSSIGETNLWRAWVCGSRKRQSFNREPDWQVLGTPPIGIEGEGDRDNLKPTPPSATLATNNFTSRPLLITGHSKGAAVAKRCALALHENKIPVTAVITFGEPRGGDSRYAAIYQTALGDRTLRVTNAADPVPWLPAWLAGNRHCGPEAFLPARRDALITGPALASKLWSDGWEIYRAWQLQQLTPLNDHHIDNYLHRLAAL